MPIYNNISDVSDETVRFCIYRAVATGSGGFGKAEPLVEIVYDPPEASNTLHAAYSGTASAADFKKIKASYIGAATQLTLVDRIINFYFGDNHLVNVNKFNPGEPDIVYFDSDVEAGKTYKYWASSWDSTGNESVWSQAAIIGVPSEAKPKAPEALEIAVKTLIDNLK
ncbi:MAG: hypothetical protein FWG13_08595 [Leptospirales bacterium]|nr:hypothetical protein [Leptospirales bacterium]